MYIVLWIVSNLEVLVSIQNQLNNKKHTYIYVCLYTNKHKLTFDIVLTDINF